MLHRALNRRTFLQLMSLTVTGLAAGCGGSASVSVAPSTAASASAATGSAASSTSAQGSGAPSAAASAAGSAQAAASGGVGTLKVSYGSPVGSFAALWMAKQIGGFERYGVSVDMSLIQTSAAVPALIAGGLDAMEVSAAPVITTDLNGNEDLVFIASALNHPILGLYAVSSITNAEQLKGQVIASDRPGTPVDYAARLALSLMGLKPSDVEIRPVGNSTAIQGALLSGQIKVGMAAPPSSFQLEAKGFHLLQDIYSKPYQNVGVVAKRSRLDELASRLRPFLAAYRDGVVAWNKQPDLAKKVLTQYGKVTDQSILDKTYDFYTKTAPFEPSLQPTIEGIQVMTDFLGQTNVPKAKGVKAQQFVDARFLNQLPKASASA